MPNLPRREPFPAAYDCARYFHSSSGSLAKLTANRRASSLVSRLAAERRPGSRSIIEIARPLPPLSSKGDLP